jgi:2-polyprenyl-3-methyl-5-hydroxy-6-metoxy-1,4-benzoquinol methylase
MRGVLQKQTLASFDSQWAQLPEGDALLTEPWFREHVDSIITDELICVSRDWFSGKSVLDAGCGNGRWTIGLLRLGCHVTAVDASPHALERLHESIAELCTPAEQERLSAREANLLELPAELASESFDLVFSFGVLHHTGDTRRALKNVAALVGPAGMLFLYLYGSRSLSPVGRALLELRRLALAPLPFALKRKVLAAVYRRSDTHQVFDCLSPTINTRHTFEQVRPWLEAEGFPSVEQTIPASELFVRALRDEEPLRPYLRSKPSPPYWYERYA